MTALTRYAVLCRSRLDGDTLHGHAAMFGVLAKVPGGYERLATTAFDGLLDRSDSDVVALVEHDPGRVLGRQSSGTLRLKVDGDGLGFEVDLPDTSYANDLRSLVARGDVTGASFGFVPGEDEWSQAPDGLQLRTHTHIRHLRDVSPVTFPAYAGAGVALRSYDFDQADGRSQMIRARARLTLKEG
ncbi:MAG: HK97 family phage prohead protease [Gammaproteobacteria bacterium]